MVDKAPSPVPPLAEIDPKLLFENAPAVLRQLAMMTDAILFYVKAGWYAPPPLIQAAGDATALMFKLRKDLQSPKEPV